MGAAIAAADEARVYDNSSARRPFRLVARYEHGRQVGPADFPPWSPPRASYPVSTARSPSASSTMKSKNAATRGVRRSSCVVSTRHSRDSA